MENHTMISQMKAGDAVEGFYLLSQAQVKRTANGSSYLAARLSDSSGSMEARMWDYSEAIGSGDQGKIVKVRGTVADYRGSGQLVIDKLRLKQKTDQIDPSALAPSAPISVEDSSKEVEVILESITDDDYRGICYTMLERHIGSFLRIPAAKKVHHAFLHGLLMHTLNMLRIADFLCGLYGSFLDRNLLIAGAFLHDFGKSGEFLYSELGTVSDYSTAGQLLGHLVLCAEEVGEVGKEIGAAEEKVMLLKHLILSHHGQPEYGAAVRPACAESEALAQIDMLDARLEQIRELLEQLEVNSFSENSCFLGGRKLYKHTISCGKAET